MRNAKDIILHFREMYYGQFRNDLRLVFKPPLPPQVDFLGCGAQKSGTTALDNYLRQHPEISLPEKKEIHYFDIEYNFRYLNIDHSKYHSFFNIKPNHKIAGEVTPSYMYWDSSPRRIWEYNPNIKIIILLRNPIQRAYSHWNMSRSRAIETLSFLDAVNQEQKRRRGCLPFQSKYFSYLDRGLYSSQIRRIYNYYPEEQVKIFKSSQLDQDPIGTMSEIFSFLEVHPIKIQPGEKVHRGRYDQPMTAEEKAYLLDFYTPEIRTLEQLLNWDCSEWLK